MWQKMLNPRWTIREVVFMLLDSIGDLFKEGVYYPFAFASVSVYYRTQNKISDFDMQDINFALLFQAFIIYQLYVLMIRGIVWSVYYFIKPSETADNGAQPL
jgi:hypothetical protein